MKIEQANFENEVLKSELPVLVDFFAVWCMPCKMISPILEELENEYAGKLKIVKVDIDEAQNITGNYNIRSVPTLMFFKNGEVVDQILGAAPKNTLKDKIDSIL